LAKANEALQVELDERRKIEEMLQQSRNTLRSVFDSISDPLIMVDRDLYIRMANRATVDYFHSADYLEILGKSFMALAHDHFDHDLLNSVHSAVLHFEESSFESNSPQKSGKYEKVFIYPTHEEYRVSGSAIVRISDITKEKIMTTELIQQEKLASLGLLVSSVTHEINNPNNFILFNVPILRDYLCAMLPIVQEQAEGRAGFEIMGMSADAFREDVLKLLTNVQNGAERIHATIAKFIGFSKKRTCDKKVSVEPCEPIEKAVSICRHEIKRTIRTFEVDVEANLPTNLADPWALEQVIINLLINASQVTDKEDSKLWGSRLSWTRRAERGSPSRSRSPDAAWTRKLKRKYSFRFSRRKKRWKGNRPRALHRQEPSRRNGRSYRGPERTRQWQYLQNIYSREQGKILSLTCIRPRPHLSAARV
jgi:nitrogen-specific signal transduction histidine kinase